MLLITCYFLITALADQLYPAVGTLIAYSVVHRGPLPTFCSDMFYDILVIGGNEDSSKCPKLDPSLLHEDLRNKLDQVSYCLIHFTQH